MPTPRTCEANLPCDPCSTVARASRAGCSACSPPPRLQLQLGSRRQAERKALVCAVVFMYLQASTLRPCKLSCLD
eukprot:10598961-Alexandrium_andersonii.AAC.1